MLYSNAAPIGAVIIIVPVGVVQVGCTVTLAVGEAGFAGIGFTVSAVGEETHPVAVLRTVALYAPGVNPVKVAAA
jgi:hypothetical protein